MRPLSTTVQNLEQSQTLALTALAQRLRREGRDIVTLTAGEPDFPTPSAAKEAARKALQDNLTRYTANEGTAELLDTIRQKLARDNGIHLESDQILVSSGAKQSIFNAIMALCSPGDEVVIVSPYWVSYPEMVKLVQAIPVVVATAMTDRFLPDPGKIRESLTQRTKALILNSPGNPSGMIYPREVCEAIAEIVRETGVFVVSDEIYEMVVYEGHRHFSIGSLEGVSGQVITVNGVSKAYAMTGWRIGYMGGPRPVVEAAAKVQSQTTSNANSIAQFAAMTAIRDCRDDVTRMVAELQRRRDVAFRALEEIPGVEVLLPEGAIYAFFKVDALFGREGAGRPMRTSADIARYLLEENRVAVVPGSAFGEEGFLRLSFGGAIDQLESGLERISEGLQNLK
jgi:aspartate aminotransferase